eukprot:m.171104 g.171104  ORF g.171104 m.171104 type:complete len:135 (+) comp9933_c1_seq6:165-569(+)
MNSVVLLCVLMLAAAGATVLHLVAPPGAARTSGDALALVAWVDTSSNAWNGTVWKVSQPGVYQIDVSIGRSAKIYASTLAGPLAPAVLTGFQMLLRIGIPYKLYLHEDDALFFSGDYDAELQLFITLLSTPGSC